MNLYKSLADTRRVGAGGCARRPRSPTASGACREPAENALRAAPPAARRLGARGGDAHAPRRRACMLEMARAAHARGRAAADAPDAGAGAVPDPRAASGRGRGGGGARPVAGDRGAGARVPDRGCAGAQDGIARGGEMPSRRSRRGEPTGTGGHARSRLAACASRAVALRAWLALVLVQAALAMAAAAQDGEIRMPRHPAPSPDGAQIAFSYQGDLWIVSSEGGEARRLTAHPAYDAHPRLVARRQVDRVRLRSRRQRRRLRDPGRGRRAAAPHLAQRLRRPDRLDARQPRGPLRQPPPHPRRRQPGRLSRPARRRHAARGSARSAARAPSSRPTASGSRSCADRSPGGAAVTKGTRAGVSG